MHPTQLSLQLQAAEKGLGPSAQGPDGWPISRQRIRRAVLASLDAQVESAELTLRLVGEAEGRRLNLDYRGRNAPTNVLTFAYSPPPDLCADLVLCLPVVAREARAQRKPLDHHLIHLIVHGCLHACGLDHENDDEAEAMEEHEAAILRRFRIPNPYGTIKAP